MPLALGVCCVRAGQRRKMKEGRPEGRPLEPMLAERKRGGVAMTLLSFVMKMGVGGRRRPTVCLSPSASAACKRQRRMKGGQKVGRWSLCWPSGREVA